MAQEITQARLKELLHYDPETGVFTWVQYVGGRAIAGGLAGTTKSNGYRSIDIDGTRNHAHRLAWLYVFGEMPNGMLDHRDQDKSNNRISNLRAVTRNQNMLNTRLPSTNTSGYKGVSWNKNAQKWVASIKIDQKLRHLGIFENILDAVAARKAAEVAFGVSEFCPQ